ncbi:MAG: hypothetical protein J6X78_00160 [Treponema sp.]|nr:hypothetical protein [Treponema sp.]
MILMLFIVIGTTAYKAIAINHSGIYASNKLIRSKDYGLCMLITYKPEYQTNIAKGFVITNIPNKEFFSKRLRSNFSSYSIADSEDMLNVYKVMASVSDNKILDSVFDIMSLAVDFYGNRFINGLFDYVSDSYQSIKSVELGKYGKYFVISSSDIEKDKPYY